MQLAQYVLDTYLLKRKLGGISERWLAHIEYVLENYLESMEWRVDESKTLHYLEQLKDNYSTCSYRKRALQIRKFLKANNIIWADQIKIPAEPLGFGSITLMVTAMTSSDIMEATEETFLIGPFLLFL